MAYPNVLSISGTVARAKEEGLPVSEYTLRRALHAGAIPCRRVGRTYLVAWSNVTKWILCEDGADNAPSLTEAGGVRRLEVGA